MILFFADFIPNQSRSKPSQGPGSSGTYAVKTDDENYGVYPVVKSRAFVYAWYQLNCDGKTAPHMPKGPFIATQVNSTRRRVEFAIDTLPDATQLSPTIGNPTDPVEQRTANQREADQSCFCFCFFTRSLKALVNMSYKQACFSHNSVNFSSNSSLQNSISRQTRQNMTS